MNKLFSKIAAASVGLAMAVGVGVAVGHEAKAVRAGTSYVKETSSISAGDVVLFVYESGSQELSAISTTTTKYGIGASYTTVPAGAFELTVEAGTKDNTFAFKNGDNYLTWTSGNSLNVNSTKSDNTSWTVSFSGGNAVITNYVKDGSDSRIVRWNSTSPRFACYKNGQQDIQLYKKVEVTPGAVTGVSLDHSFEIIKAGSPLSLTATVVPNDATNKNVTWNSSVTSVATVSSDGVVTPVAKGSTVITVTTVDGGFTATCTVVVADHVGTEADPLFASDAIIVANTAGEAGTSAKYFIKGDVSAISFSGTNLQATATIADASSSFSLYKFYDVDHAYFADDTKIIVTDTIVVNSTIGTHSGNPQAAYGDLVSVTRNVSLTSVEIRGNVTANQYVGEAWNISELSVYAIYSNSDEVDVTSSASIVCNPLAPSAAGAQSFTVDATFDTVAATQRVFNVDVKTAAVTVDDVVTSSLLVATENKYVNFGPISVTSSAEYVGNSALGDENAIQLRSKDSNSGIISTKSGGFRIKSVAVDVKSGSNTIQIYGSNTAYSGEDASALYNNDTKGTLLGTLTASGTIVVTGDYRFVGLRSANGALYINSITFTWEQCSADDVVNEIKTLAGGWENPVKTESCSSNYAKVKGMVLSLSSTELDKFMNSDNAEYAAARETYEHWCAVNGDNTPYSGEIVSSSMYNEFGTFENNGSTIIIIIAATFAVTTFGAILLIRKKKHSK